MSDKLYLVALSQAQASYLAKEFCSCDFVVYTTNSPVTQSAKLKLIGHMPTLNQEQIAQFDRDGYLLIEKLFDREEMDLLMQVARADQQIFRNALERMDLASGKSKLWITGDLEEDIYSAFVHCHRLVEPL